ncbi:MAG: DUF362 domain-containing protein [Eubacterium sp.]|nr:DUF362 domain-containing protein [Eubacterium sp.]
MNPNEIIKRYGSDPMEMTISLLKYAGLAALIGDTNKRIGIKPNLVTPTPASYGATTHPEIVEGIVSYLQEHGFKNIIITEGSWVGDRTSEAYEYCGYRSVCEKYDVPFIDTQKEKAHAVDLAGMELNICDVVDRIDFLINVPVLKGHCQTRMTCALKNMKGLIPNSEKRRFHTMGLHKPIAYLSLGIRQDFIVVDHICGDPSFEEGGNPVKTDCVMVAADPVLIDSYACKILGRRIDEVPYIGMAEALGSGSSDLSCCTISVINEHGEVLKQFAGNDPDPYAYDLKSENALDVSVAVDEVDSCSACFAAFVGAVNRLRDEGVWDERKNGIVPGQDSPNTPNGHMTTTRRQTGKIAIGQGHRGKTGTFGIGNCCREFDTYVPGCPPREEDIYEAISPFDFYHQVVYNSDVR